MILFKARFAPLILSGKKTQTRRRHPGARKWNVGVTHQARCSFSNGPFARLEIVGVSAERLGETTEADARREGFASLAAFRKEWEDLGEVWDPRATVWVIDFRVVG